MNSIDKEQFLIEAKKRAKRHLVFYVHLVGYFIGVALLLYNLYIVGGVYKSIIISLNLSILVAWTVFIIIHGLNVFKRKQIFKKSWEDKRTAEFLNKQDEIETIMWE